MRPHQTLTRRSLILFLLLILLSPWAHRSLSQSVAQESPTTRLTLRILGAKNDDGQVAIAVFRSEAGFPGDKSKALRTLQVKIDPNSKSTQVTLADLPHGDYAIAIFHDENKNGQLDKNMFGLPKEGYGFSNILKKSMGAPKFADAKFRLDRLEQYIDIKLLYEGNALGYRQLKRRRRKRHAGKGADHREKLCLTTQLETSIGVRC